MRRRISVQSCASVPPVPAWIETTASPASYSPVKRESSCRRSSSRRSATDALLDLVELPVVGGELDELPQVVGIAAELLVALEPARETCVLGG